MERSILHSDCNCFYASVEHLHHPELAGKPLAVGGSPLSAAYYNGASDVSGDAKSAPDDTRSSLSAAYYNGAFDMSQNPEAKQGIVLTADYFAKKSGVKTGMALWQAKQACPDLTFVPRRMDLYLRFSRMAHEIYSEYTDRQEPMGLMNVGWM